MADALNKFCLLVLNCEHKAFVFIGHTQPYESLLNTLDHLLLKFPHTCCPAFLCLSQHCLLQVVAGETGHLDEPV